MEKTGLVDKLVRNMGRSWETRQLANESQEIKQHNESLVERLSLLKQVKATKDLNLALGLEEMMLRQELALYANSPEQHNSVNTAIEQLLEARKSLAIVHDPKGYQDATATYSGKRKEAGLPINSFREFLKGHSTRLTNHMKGPLSVPEKSILRERKEILGMVKEVYMGLQRKALGFEAPTQDRALGR